MKAIGNLSEFRPCGDWENYQSHCETEVGVNVRFNQTKRSIYRASAHPKRKTLCLHSYFSTSVSL